MSKRKRKRGKSGNPVPDAVPRGSRITARASYDAATTGRRLGGWTPANSGPNSAVSGSLGTLRTRSRDSLRNNGLTVPIVDTWVSALVGSGFTPRWHLPNLPEVKEELQETWKDSAHEIDADGRHDFNGLVALACRGTVESGECLARYRPRRPDQGFVVPLQLQLLEPDHIDETRDGAFQNGRTTRMGIEIDRLGRRRFYWLRSTHPGDPASSSMVADFVSHRIPAAQVLHVYRQLRPGQLRGVPWLAPALLALHQFDLHRDNELMRQAAAAAICGWLIPGAESVKFGTDEGTDPSGTPIVGAEPGTYVELPAGFEVRNSHPAELAGGYEAWNHRQLQQIAGSVGIPYENLTGDLRGVSFSSLRWAMVDFRRRAEMLQRALLVHQLCRPFSLRWLETGALAGSFETLTPEMYLANRRLLQRVRWQPAPWQWVDPLKDLQAKALAVESGFTSRSQVAIELGNDPSDLDHQIAEDRLRQSDLGLAFGGTAPQPATPEDDADTTESLAAQARDLPIVAENRETGERLVHTAAGWRPFGIAA